MKSKQENETRRQESDRQYNNELAQLQWEKEKYSMDLESKRWKDRAAREDRIRAENRRDEREARREDTSFAFAADAGVWRDDTRTGWGTNEAASLALK